MPVSRQLIKEIYEPREKWSHKGDFGKLLVVGGSALYSGSPIFNALAAYRSGCDLVRIIAPEEAARAAKAFSPDLIAYPLQGDYLGKKHVKEILKWQKDSDSMIIGGGLSREKQTLDAVRIILSKTRIPAVIDADAIYALNKKTKPGKNAVITPHGHEFYVLAGKKVTNDVKDRINKTKELAQKLGCTVLLKGHIDIISDGKRTTTNETGSVYMTKGGFGDTLTGICGALLARRVHAYESACAAAWINGRAGELAANKYMESTLASDLINEIHNAIR